MNEVCKHLDLCNASEGVLITTCEQLMSLAQNLSYSSAVCFASTCLLPLVSNFQ